MTVRRSSFQAIGTKWDLFVHDDIAEDAWDGLLVSLHSRIDDFDKAYSRFRSDSLVTEISRTAGKYDLPDDGHTLLQTYRKLYEATNGAVTPLIGQVMHDAGYDAEYSLQAKPMQPPPAWESVVTYDKNSLTVSQPVLLDFGAAGKGYLVDLLAEIIMNAGIANFTINASGDILHRSKSDEEIKVGLENPLDTTEAIGVVTLSNRSLCASAGSKRAWGEFTHIIDPSTLQSPDEILATWVIADDTITADGLATALFFTKPEELQQTFSFAYALLGKDMQLQYSKEFPVMTFED